MSGGRWPGIGIARSALSPGVLLNGTFASDLSYWTLADSSGGTVAWNAGKMRVERTSGTTSGYQPVLLTGGVAYRFTCVATYISGSVNKASLTLRNGTLVTSPSLGTIETAVGGSGTLTLDYTPGSTMTAYLHPTVGGGSGIYDFDDVTLGLAETPANVSQRGTGSSIEFVPGQTGNLTKDTGTAAGDLALILVSWHENSGRTITTPSGFTLIGQQVIDGSSPSRNFLTLFARECDGTEGASYTISFSDGVYGTALLMTLTGGDLSVASVTFGTPASGLTATAPSVTGAIGQALVAAYATGDPTTMTTPSVMTVGTAGLQNTNTGRFFFQNLSADGATGAKTSTLGTSRANLGCSILVNDA